VLADMTMSPEEHAERFDPEHSTGLLVDAEHRLRYALGASLAEGRRVLDAGCGTGYGARMLADAGAAALSAFDISEDAVVSTQASLGDDADVVCADLCDQPYEDGSFDLAVCFEVIEHIDRQDQAIRELRRVLAPGGILLISSPNPDVYPPGNPHHVHEYTPGELEGALSEHFGHVGLLRQHPYLASAILADSRPSGPIEAMMLTELEAGAQTYTIAVAADDESVIVTDRLVLADAFEVRWWEDQLRAERDARHGIARRADAAEVRASRAEAELTELRGRLFELSQQGAELAELRVRVTELNDERLAYGREVDAALAERDERLRRAERVITDVTTSLSWQITRPLRALRRLFR
jgi:SAM-dependent methyltransferase